MKPVLRLLVVIGGLCVLFIVLLIFGEVSQADLERAERARKRRADAEAAEVAEKKKREQFIVQFSPEEFHKALNSIDMLINQKQWQTAKTELDQRLRNFKSAFSASFLDISMQTLRLRGKCSATRDALPHVQAPSRARRGHVHGEA